MINWNDPDYIAAGMHLRLRPQSLSLTKFSQVTSTPWYLRLLSSARTLKRRGQT
jgi:hypothetical protein